MRILWGFYGDFMGICWGFNENMADWGGACRALMLATVKVE